MNEFVDGSVVICGVTGQAGTIILLTGIEAWLLLRNGDVWVGPTGRVRFPQDQADLDAAPINVERLEVKRAPRTELDRD